MYNISTYTIAHDRRKKDQWLAEPLPKEPHLHFGPLSAVASATNVRTVHSTKAEAHVSGRRKAFRYPFEISAFAKQGEKAYQQ